MQRTDDADIESGGFFEKILHLCAVFSDNAEIISSCFTSPVFIHIQRAELAETVSREQHFILAVIGNDDFGPVYHRRCDKMQGMCAKLQRTAFTDNDPSVLKLRAKEIAHHGERLCAGNNDSLRIVLHKIQDIGAVVRFHMLNNKIIGFSAVKGVFKIVQPFLCKVAVNGVHDSDLAVHDDIGIVCHAVRNIILTLKQVDLVVIHAHISDIVGNIHFHTPLSKDFCTNSIS